MSVVIDGLGPARPGGRAPKRPPQGSLYARREPIYPKLVRGPFRRLKWALLLVMLGVYYGVPWLRWPRPSPAPDQAVLVDFVYGRFYFFMIHLWPDEVYFITGLLVLSALGLFFVTAMFGRVWCGYACPQTVWTDLFIAVERWFEGDRNARIRRNDGRPTLNTVVRKIGKHGVWLLIAMATGGAWILYFHDAPTVARQFFVGQAPATAYIFFWLMTFTTYALAGLMREQVCTYMCPWPRIQGAMIDRETLQVTYRFDRGEPRAAHKKGASWDGRGDCIDCRVCVAVCPMGIDIREGLQLACIDCALCIDACDEVMVKVDRPRGLIAYDAEARVVARAEGRPAPVRLVRPRTIFYALALTLISGLMVYGFVTRPPLGLHVVRDRSPFFVRLHDGSIRNGYTLEIANRTFAPRRLEISVLGLAGARLKRPGEPGEQVVAGADQVTPVRLFVASPAAGLKGPLNPVDVQVSDADAPASAPLVAKSTFVWDGGAPQ